MPRRHYILYLNNAGLTPCEIGRNRVEIEPPCPPTTEGYARFEHLLHSIPSGCRMTILTDLPDEAHHLESLPFIRGKDRHNMLDRRRRHLFGDTPFTLTRSLGRSPEGRRDEQILFAALPRPAVITPWLECIAVAGHVLGGIVSVPFLTRHLLPADITDPMLVAHATPAGFRVSCFAKRQPRFSRLTALATAPGLSGNTWQDELRRSTDYLLNQRILPRDTATPVLLIHTRALELPPDADLHAFHPALSIRVKPSMSAAPGISDSLLHGLLDILSRHPGQPQFAPSSMLAPHRRLILAQATRMVAAASVLVFSGLALHDLGTIRELRQQKETNLARVHALEAQASQLRGTLPMTPHTLARLESDLTTLEALQRAPLGPEADLRRLADALSGNPAIQLDSLAWQHLPPTQEAEAGIQASRSLEIRLAPHARDTQNDVKPLPLMSLLRTLRQWPGAEVQQASETTLPTFPGTQGGDAATNGKATSDHPTIRVRWRPPQ